MPSECSGEPPRSRQRLNWTCLLGSAVLTVVGMTGCIAYSRASAGDDDYGPVGAFALTERSGRTVTRDDLLGKTWVASFVFTRCAGPCPQVSGNMARLQKELAGHERTVLVTFTVDPEYDTPQVLREYAARYGADPGRWLFLTGPQDQIYPLIRQSFLSAVEQNRGSARTPGAEVTHSTRLFVVDRRGHVRGLFDGRQVDETGQPVNDVPRVFQKVVELEREGSWLRGEDLPSLNALLNFCSAVLLLVGYVAVRRRRLRLHISCMLTALVISGLFLASYLYYHFGVKHGRPTPFPGEGWSRGVYFMVLGTHTILAAAVAPLALYTAYLGLSGRFKRHMHVARWTFPLWLYVSVTGVVVYWMLYRLYPPTGDLLK